VDHSRATCGTHQAQHTVQFHAFCAEHTPHKLLPKAQRHASTLQQRIQLRLATQSELRIKGRADLLIPSRTKGHNKRQARLTAQRISNAVSRSGISSGTSPSLSSRFEDHYEPGRCACCMYTNAELQQILRDEAVWKIEAAERLTDDYEREQHAQLSKPMLPYPHERAPNKRIQEMMTCNKCRIDVHPICYGIPEHIVHEAHAARTDAIRRGLIDAQSDRSYWVCRRCEKGMDSKYVSCVVCQRSGGAFKPVQGSNTKWCHVMCAFWIQGIEFADVEKLG
jgi:hypothetical protein